MIKLKNAKIGTDLNYNKGVYIDIELIHNKTSQLTIDLKPIKDNTIFSMSGSIGYGRDIELCGQIFNYLNLDQIKFNKNISSNQFKRLIEIWKQYHSNDLKSGTASQENFIKEYNKNNPSFEYDYKKICNILKNNNLLIDNNHEYGSTWLFEEIPFDIQKEIIELCSNFMDKIELNKAVSKYNNKINQLTLDSKEKQDLYINISI